MKEEIANIRNELTALITGAESRSELEDLRVVYLGRKGRLTALIKRIGKLPEEQRRESGYLINQTKKSINKLLSHKISDLKKSEEDWQDPTMPGIPPRIGHTHIMTHAINEIAEIFVALGFNRMRYPEVEWDWYAFESLNFSKDHPARDNWETFFVDAKPHPKYGPLVLTPHTSSGQVREMESRKPPIRMINIAKCYRRQSDVSHLQMFHQFEGLVVDENISIAHLKGTIDHFVKAFFGNNRKTRLRPHDFPFTEPSFEVDITCDVCDGKGCKLCKEGWLELAGAGMVHPNVLRNGGIDPKKYSGFAFGWGVERAFMMKSGLKIADIRTLYTPSISFLKQF